MRESQAMIADHVLDAIDLSGCHLLVDIGGGTGAFAHRALDTFNTLKATVFDLPAVATAGAELNIDNPRLRFAGGDMFTGPLPLGADAMSFNRVLHDHDDDKVRKVLRNAYSALKPGGQIVIAEPMAETPGAEPIGHAYFGLYLWSLGSGRPRTLEELSRLLKGAGFCEISEQKTSMPCLVRVVTGIKSIS